MKKTLSLILSFTLLFTTMANFTKTKAITTNTDFITSMTDIDEILARPYDSGVPSGFSELIFASHSDGYGFDKNTISMTGQNISFDMQLDVTVDGHTVKAGEGIYRPSYVESTYDLSDALSQQTARYMNLAPLAKVSATYEYAALALTYVASFMKDGVISYDNNVINRWATWNSPNNADTITFDLGHTATVDKIDVHYYTDGAGTLFPSNVVIKYLDGEDWKEVTGITYPTIVNNAATVYEFDAVTTQKIAITLTRAASNKGMAVTEVEIFGKYSLPYTNLAPLGNVSATYEYTAAAVKNYASCMTDGIINYENTPVNRWATWNSPNDADTITFDLGRSAAVDKILLHYFTDGGNTTFPSNVVIKYLDGEEWKEVTGITYPTIVQNAPTVYKFDAVTTQKIAITLTRAASNKGMAITEAEIFGSFASPYTNLAPLGNVSATYEYTAAAVKNYASCMTDGIINYENTPVNRWATWNSPNNADTITFDFGNTATVDKIDLHYFTDGGGTLFPSNVIIKYLDGEDWKEVTGITYPTIVQNAPTVYKFDAVTTQKIAITLTRAASNKGMAITEAEIFGSFTEDVFDSFKAEITEKKIVTANDIAASIITVTNTGEQDKTVTVNAKNTRGVLSEVQLGKYVTMSGDGFVADTGSISKTVTIKSGESAEFITALSFADTEADALSQADAFFADKNRLETHKTEYFDWFKQNVPFFECSDEQITQMYWFRWLTYRNNIRKLTTGKYMISEFVPNVGWSGAYNSITAAVHQHIGEGRWLKDSKYINDYKDFWFENDGIKYTYYIAPFATAYYSDYLANGDKDNLVSHLDDLISVYNMWENKTAGDSEGYFDENSGLWYVGNGHDAMEFSLSYHIAGTESGTKVSINAYMYSEAISIAKIAELAGQTDIAEQYRQKAATIKASVESKLWNENDSFFETYVPSQSATIDALELTGYMPWYTGLATDSEEYAKAWKYLADPDTFYGAYGPSTADKGHTLYNTYYTDTTLGRSDSCNWDGSSWPFASSLTLVAAANTLNDYENNATLTVGDYYKTLKAYTNGMYKNGYAWVGENLDSDTGKWYIDHTTRSWHYNHSSYADLIITGLVGLRPDDNSDGLVINPLVPENTLSHFVLENVSYRGKNVTVVYDEDGSHYDAGAGLSVFVNGRKTAHSDSIEQINITYNDAENTTTGEQYKTLDEALDNAQNGETIKLLEDAELRYVTVGEGVTLDINGHKLTADYVTGFDDSNIVDNNVTEDSGLYVSKKRLVVSENNAQLPIYDSENGCYMFTSVSLDYTYYEDSNYYFGPEPPELDTVEGARVNALLRENSETTGVQIIVHLDWETDDYYSTQDFTYKSNYVDEYFTMANSDGHYQNVYFYARFMGDALKQADTVTVTTIVQSDRGAQFVSAPTEFSLK